MIYNERTCNGWLTITIKLALSAGGHNPSVAHSMADQPARQRLERWRNRPREHSVALYISPSPCSSRARS